MRHELRQMITCLRTQGILITMRTFGWKFFFLVTVYYLVRDTCLYVILPWAVLKTVSFLDVWTIVPKI